MDKKTKIIVYSSIIILIVLILGGFSYAYYVASINHSETSKTISGTLQNLEITFANGVDTVSATEIVPGWTDTKTFSISNTAATNPGTAYYKLRIYDVNIPFVAGGLKYSYTSTNSGAQMTTPTAIALTESLISGSTAIAPNVTQTYTMTFTYDNLSVDQTADMGQSFSFKIGVVASKA